MAIEKNFSSRWWNEGARLRAMQKKEVKTDSR